MATHRGGRGLGRRATCTLLAVLAAAATTVACQPATPRPVFHPVATATGADAEPGDGSCATATDQCSLEAAFDEANAHPRARIEMSRGTYPPIEATATGNLEIVGASGAVARETFLRVLETASVTLRRVSLGALSVDGAVVAERLQLGYPGPSEVPNLTVGPDGSVLLFRAVIVAWLQPGVRNEGRLNLRYTTLMGGRTTYSPPDPVITTSGAGRTTLGASLFMGQPQLGDMVDACAGTPPTSEGWNVSYDTTCGLDQTGDAEGHDTVGGGELHLLRTDVIPVGTLGCHDGPTDVFGLVEAIDADLDGVAACDVGAEELYSIW